MSLTQVWVKQVLRGLRGTFSEVTTFTLPESAEMGQRLDFAVEGHLFGVPTWPNFATGFFYNSGPMEKITVTMDGQTYELTPGSGFLKYTTILPAPSHRQTLTCSMTLQKEGTYEFAAYTGWFDVTGAVFRYDDEVKRPVTVTTVIKPPWWPDWIPFEYWWVIAAGGGALVLITIVGIVTYQERQREEMLMMLMKR